MVIEDWQRGFDDGRNFEKRWLWPTLAMTIFVGLAPASMVAFYGIKAEEVAEKKLELLRSDPPTVYQCGPVGE
jgi:hypothetical protein